MKKRIEVYSESGLDENGRPVRTMVKSFRNEPEAIAFYNDQRNIRRYGTLSMQKNTEHGDSLSWDDRRMEWVVA